MSRLTEDVHEALSQSVLEKLFRRSIFTCVHFVRTDPELLARITGLKFSAVVEVKNRILKRYSSRLRYGQKYYEEFLSNCAIIRSGIENLDKLLDSGFMTGNIYELCGFAGSGKTQICMTVAANICTSTEDQRVFYIDTKNDISAHRLADIIQTRAPHAVGETLRRIHISHIRTAHDLLHQLHQLQATLLSSNGSRLPFRLLIIDSLSALFQRFHDHAEGLSLLNNVANMLRYFSNEYHVAVVLTNVAVSWSGEEREGEGEREGECEGEEKKHQQMQHPGLGKYWAHVPSVRIMVKKRDVGNEMFLIVVKSQDQPVGKSVRVKLGVDGVT